MPHFVDTHDFMNRSSVLQRHGNSRVSFDPTNEAHVASFKKFIQTGNWGDVQFYTEFPYTDAPTTVSMRLHEHNLGVTRDLTKYEK